MTEIVNISVKKTHVDTMKLARESKPEHMTLSDHIFTMLEEYFRMKGGSTDFFMSDCLKNEFAKNTKDYKKFYEHLSKWNQIERVITPKKLL